MSTKMEVSTNTFRANDPTRATCRGSLQSKRSQLNREIHREMRLRAGAENLLKATSNRTVKETATLELSFVNSHLQLLREQLSEINGCLEAYQGQGQDNSLPMIPLGLKETSQHIDFLEPFKDFILEHYSEDGNNLDDAIQSFMELRQAMRRPSRTKTGVQLLLRYLGVLYFVERRFFPADRNIGVFFEWYDALTGVPSIQRTVAFEKASVLFNLAALHTQIGSKQDRLLNSESADAAVDNFLRAAGTLRYIGEHFTHPPSFDLAPHTLDALTALFLVQARECLFEKQQSVEKVDSSKIIENVQDQSRVVELAQEAQLLSDEYVRVSELLSHEELKEFIPPAWSSLVQVKRDLYKCLAHHYLSTLLLSECEFSDETRENFRYLYCETENVAVTDIRLPTNEEEMKVLGFCHLRKALSCLEDSSRHARLNRELRAKKGLQSALQSTKDKILATFERKEIQSLEELEHYLDPPQLIAATKFQLELSPPDLATQNVEDPFRALGPLALFSAKRHWSAPRHVTLHRRGDGFGLSVKGSAPVAIASIDDGSPAELGGVRQGDVIVGIGGVDTRWMGHEDVVALVRTTGDSLALRLVTPMDVTKNSSHHHSHKGRISPHSTSSSTSLGSSTPRSSSSSSSGYGGSYGRSVSRNTGSASPQEDTFTMKKLTKSLFRKSKSKEKVNDATGYKSNMILR
ncbi:rhophilin-2-B [Folsomia candida]|uniref:rhophilin-2-B n=1 Tax=Folsomia candida TaxID=158441 RepID=UPI000B908718|nr:rhophilin-2-B [Folsomia candida]